MGLYHQGCDKTKFRAKHALPQTKSHAPVLGLQSCQRLTSSLFILSLLKQQIPDNIKELQNRFPYCFDRIGNFPDEISLNLKHDATPYTKALRKSFIHLKDKIKQALDSMESKCITKKVDTDTD